MEKRYAIRFSDGTYSSGPRMARVEIGKAKLWKNIGHVKNHLKGLGAAANSYLPDAQIVEMEVTYTEKNLVSVAEVIHEAKEKEAIRKAEYMKRFAERELEVAKNRLHEAERLAAAYKAARDLPKAYSNADLCPICHRPNHSYDCR